MEASRFELPLSTERARILADVVDPIELAARALVKLREQGLSTLASRPDNCELPVSVEVLSQRLSQEPAAPAPSAPAADKK